MTMRTVKIQGLAYGATPASITVTYNGETVFSGEVPTQDAPVPALPDLTLDSQLVDFCTFEIPVEAEGEFPMTCTVHSGTAVFGPILSNYNKSLQADGTWLIRYPPATTFANIRSNLGDPRTNIIIDGEPQPEPPVSDPPGGAWWWEVQEGSVLAFDAIVLSGMEHMPTTP